MSVCLKLYISLKFFQPAHYLLRFGFLAGHQLILYFSDEDAVVSRIVASHVLEPLLCYGEILAMLGPCSVYLHLVCVV